VSLNYLDKCFSNALKTYTLNTLIEKRVIMTTLRMFLIAILSISFLIVIRQYLQVSSKYTVNCEGFISDTKTCLHNELDNSRVSLNF